LGILKGKPNEQTGKIKQNGSHDNSNQASGWIKNCDENAQDE